jgi:hypothetical protein
MRYNALMRLLVLVSWLVASSVLAQDADREEPTAPRAFSPPPRVVPPAPVAPVEPPTAVVRLRNSVGIGFFGTSLIDEPITGTFIFNGMGLAPPAALSVPLIGVRWWTPLSAGPLKRVGVEVAFGVAWLSGSRVTVNNNGQLGNDTDEHLGLGLHAGIPLAIASTEHTVVFIAPEYRFTSNTITPAGAVPLMPGARQGLVAKAFANDLSLRAGLELFFGFIGLPNLSIETSVRVGLRWLETTSLPNGQMGSAVVDDSVRANSSLVNNVFDLFTGSIAAKFYL